MYALVLLTTACPVECEHCQFYCTASKEPDKWMTEKTIRKISEELVKNEINTILITGGEPLYDVKKFFSSIDIFLDYFNPSNIKIATSGFWATDKKSTKKILLEFKKRKLEIIEVGVDRFHLKRVPMKNIENILKMSNGLGIKVILRPLFDIYSEHLIKPIVNIVTKYKPHLVFCITTPVGRAENFRKELIGMNTTQKKFISLIRNEKPIDQEQMTIFTNPIVLTAFPNGNIYSCCVAAKGTFLGNIHKIRLKKLISKFRDSLPGHIFYNNLSCDYMHNMLPSRNCDSCKICKEVLFKNIKSIEREYIGRKFIEINSKNLSPKKVFNEYDPKHELLLFFKFGINDLGRKEIGNKINKFLQKISSQRIIYKICNPLPKCLFGDEWIQIFQKFGVPKNCFECSKLFSVEEGFIRYCEYLGRIKGSRLESVKSRDQIYKHFEIEHDKLKFPERCDDCLFRIRNQCNGICFGK